MENDKVIVDLIYFFLVAIIFLIGIAVIFRIFCKKFQIRDKNVELYGLLLNLNTQSLISISAITINYLFLVWCTITFKELNIIYVAVVLILVLVSEVVIDHFQGLPVSLLLAGIDCGAIQIIYLLFHYITEVDFSYILLLILCLVILFVFLYYTYNLFRGINNVVVKHKYLSKKDYKV